MEVVSGIASVAGTVAILGLVGQSVDGVLKLKKIVGLIRDADRAVKNFVGDLDSLNGTLVSIKELIERIPDEWLAGEDAVSVDVLASQIEKCRDDIKVWEKDAAKLNTKSSRSIDAFFKKLRVAGEGSPFNEFHRIVASHQQGIQISLDILGRSFDILSSKRTQVTNENVVELVQTQSALGSALSRASQSFSGQLEEMSNKLDRVDARSRGSNASMSTLASQLSYLIDLVSASSGGSVEDTLVKNVQQTGPSDVHIGACHFEWCCDTLPGIEDGFDEPSTNEAVCKYCEEPFDMRSTDWYIRGKHLADAHHFGQCNLLLSYPTSDQFKEHLAEFHRMSGHERPKFIDEHKRPTTIYQFHRGEESKSQRMMQIDEAAETEGIYHARMATILKEIEDAFSNARVSKAPVLDLTQLLWHLEREIACLQEEFIVSGHKFEALEYPVELVIPSIDADSKSRMLSESNAVPGYQMAVPKFKDEASKRGCVNLWLYEILQRSSATKIVLRDIRKAVGPNDLGTEAWIQDVLKYWTKDEAATGPDQIYVPSDGAVDSRDSLEAQARDIPERPRRVRGTRHRRASRRLRSSHKKTSPADKLEPLGIIGVCALDVKARSKPSRNILNRLIRKGEFDVVVFGDKVILDEDVENWPYCDFLISFNSDGFPLDKAIAYVKARKPFCVNDVPMQEVLRDRRIVLRILDKINVPTPKRLEVNRDGGPSILTVELAQHLKNTTGVVLEGPEDGTGGQAIPPREVELLHGGDTLRVDGTLLAKPFVEKPVSGEDHNICIYYPKSQGGGARKLFRKIGNKSSEWVEGMTIPRSILEPNSSYLYEEFIKVDNSEDVKAYTVGLNYCHAETRKSPVVDGLVRRNTHGKEIRYITSLSKEEAAMASRIAFGFGQRVCGFDLLRAEGKSYVIDVNGWNFVKDNEEYYDQCAWILRDIFIREKQRQQGGSGVASPPPEGAISPLVRKETGRTAQESRRSASQQILSKSPRPPPAPKHSWKLKGMVSVIRHADRTPKQEYKFIFHTRPFIELLKGHQEEVLLTSGAALENVMIAVDMAILEGVEDREKLRTLRNVLAKKGGWTGTKVQIKPMFRKRKPEELMVSTLVPVEEGEHPTLEAQKDTEVKMLETELEGEELKVDTPGEEALSDSDDKRPGRSPMRHDSLSGAAENSLIPDKLQLIVKWGGEPTHSARYQSQELGENMRNDLMLMNREVLDEVHVFSSSERRVTTSAQIWASAFTDQKDLPSDFITIRKDLLDHSNAAKDEMDRVEKKLETLLRQGNEPPPQFAWPANMPEPSIVQQYVVQLMKFHRRVMRHNYSKLYGGTSSSLNAIANPGDEDKEKGKPSSSMGNFMSQATATSSIQARWCCGEDAELFKERWEKLFGEFCDGDKVDLSKISELYDTMKFDALHNRQFLEWVFTPSNSILAEEEEAMAAKSKGMEKQKEQLRDAAEADKETVPAAEINKSIHGRIFGRRLVITGTKSSEEAPEPYFRLFTGSSQTKAKTDARLEKLRELYKLAKVLFDYICPQEYGMTDAEKLEIGLLTSLPLLKEIVKDLEEMQASDNAKSFIYFTKESHIYTLLNCILESGILTKIKRSAIPGLDYLSQICFELYESENKSPSDVQDVAKYAYSIRITISPGCHTFDPLDVQLDSKHCISCAPRRSLTAHGDWKQVIETLRRSFIRFELQ